MNLADKPPHKELVTRLTKAMIRQIEVLGVDIRCGVEATPEVLKSLAPEAVFVATGAKPIIPKLPGIERTNVHLAEDIVAGAAKVSDMSAAHCAALIDVLRREKEKRHTVSVTLFKCGGRSGLKPRRSASALIAR